MSEIRDRRRANYRVLLATLWLSLLVLAVKVWAGFAAQSLSLLAESLHTLIDGFSTLLSLIAATSIHWKPGRETWVHGKREAVVALLLTAFLGFTGFSVAIVAIQQFFAVIHHQAFPFAAHVNLPLIQLLCVVVAIEFCMVLFERYESRMLQSQLLRFNANHVLQDGWLTILMLISLIGTWRGYAWFDPVVAFLLVVSGIKSLWRVLNWQLPLLIQQIAIAPEVLNRLACEVEGVNHCYRIRSKGIVGRQMVIEMNLVVQPEFISMAQAIARQVEDLIRERYGPVYAIIHIDQYMPKPRRSPRPPYRPKKHL